MITASIESTSVEQWVFSIRLEEDPELDVPEFQVTAVGAPDPGATWVSGTWSTAWSATTKLAEATTPTLGGTGASLAVGTNTAVILWCRVGTVVQQIARVTVT